jgi:protein gp37
MSDNTKIEWTDATVNAVNGCSVVSPGCTNCYAMRLAGTRLKHTESRTGLTIDTKAGPVWNGTTRLSEKALMQPLRWKRPRRIFWNAHGDLFHDSVPDEWVDQCFAVMALTPQHIHQVLTKRPERMRAYLSDPAVVRRICAVAGKLRYELAPDAERFHRAFHRALQPSASLTAWTVEGGIASDMFRRQEPDRDWPSWVTWPLPNIWLGTSVEDQVRADERIPHLLATPAAVRFLSCEPLLGAIDLNAVPWDVAGYPMEGALPTPGEPDDFRYWHHRVQGIAWVIVGGESGPAARPMHPDWARSLRDQCAAAGVPFFFKQWGAWAVEIDRDRQDPDWRRDYSNEYADRRATRWLNLAGGCGFHGDRFHVMRRVGKAAAGRLLDCVQHDGLPVAEGGR